MHFEPDVILYVAHQDEFHALASHAASLVAQGLKIPSPHLQAVVNELGLSRDQAPGAIQARLQSREPELLSANYRAIVDECRVRGTTAAWVYLPVPGAGGADMRDKLVPIAKNSGFVTLDLTGWAHGRVGLFLTAEHHPNARGHELIAEALLNAIRNNPTFPFVSR